MSKLETVSLRRVRYMPEVLEPGILYLSEEFDVAVHLCACGCRREVVTPVGGTGWAFSESAAGPSLSPSIGNWGHPCRSHYYLTEGRINWC